LKKFPSPCFAIEMKITKTITEILICCRMNANPIH
jgi:hypothetical protein